jgi:hypothetical protein
VGFAVLLLLCGMLAAEVALFGFKTAGMVGAAFLVLCAAVLVANRRSIEVG